MSACLSYDCEFAGWTVFIFHVFLLRCTICVDKKKRLLSKETRSAEFRQPLLADKHVRAVISCVSIRIQSHMTKSNSMYSSRNNLPQGPRVDDAVVHPEFPEAPGGGIASIGSSKSRNSDGLSYVDHVRTLGVSG